MKEMKLGRLTEAGRPAELGISDDEIMRRARGLVRLAIEKHRLLGYPVARYDYDRQVAYLEYPDGRCEYAI